MASGIDQTSVDGFKSVLRGMIANTRRPVAGVVQQAYIHFVTSGRANTKLGKRRSDVVANPAREKDKRRAKYLIESYRPDGSINHIPTNRKNDKRRIIRRRGLAKQSWTWMFSGLGGRVGNSRTYSGKATATRIVSIASALTRATPSIAYTNRLRYLQKANPGIHNLALNKAANRMQYLLDRNIASRFEKEWRKGR